MNLVKGSFYVFYQSYKKQNLIFWTILLAIVLFSFFMVVTLVDGFTVYLMVSIPVYVFFAIMGSKWLTNTFSYFIRFGISRLQYAGMTGLFFMVWSLVTAIFTASLHQGIFFINKVLAIDYFTVFHPMYFMDSTLPFHLIFLFDFVILFFFLVSGLLLNYIFFQFGMVGGYTFIGLMAFIPLLAIALRWYEPVFRFLGDQSFWSLCGVIALIVAVLYGLIAAGLRKLSAIPS
ncbi:hypothetical protein [Ureibacillus manganicus]|uniref:Permease n=1 Tax=Ureibacillus manganicus DSM 26584 TaxID=1384049 RepID=A0A0A3HQQ4_9BACL|nr:hypothetical protein [Ureibacillus manganicus]KGR73560.1 hypothetical protein CD29_19680 [Ureibacillus manganicus DSM 26584]